MILLHGEPLAGFPTDEDASVASLLKYVGVEGGQRGIAVAVNDEVVPRSQWAAHVLADGDRVEIIRATQGG